MKLSDVTRREFLQDSALATSAVAAAGRAGMRPALGDVPKTEVVQARQVTLHLNGVERVLTVEPRETLLDVLRERLHLTGTKKGCDMGACGACTVLLDGRRVNACLVLAARLDRRRIVTIEGLAEGETLHPLQVAFIEQDGFQCGYCTPGQIMSAAGLLNEGRALDERSIREWMSGNICRCGAYPNIVAAIRHANGKA